MRRRFLKGGILGGLLALVGFGAPKRVTAKDGTEWTPVWESPDGTAIRGMHVSKNRFYVFTEKRGYVYEGEIELRLDGPSGLSTEARTSEGGTLANAGGLFKKWLRR